MNCMNSPLQSTNSTSNFMQVHPNIAFVTNIHTLVPMDLVMYSMVNRDMERT